MSLFKMNWDRFGLIEFGVVVLVVSIAGIYWFTDWFSPQEAVAFGTLVLALVTVLSVLQNRRQTEYMAKELDFIRRPRISVHHEGDDVGLIVFENTGQVPLRANFGFSLESASNTESGDPIIDDSIKYENLPDDIKVYGGGAGDWRDKSIFLEAGDRKPYGASLISREIRTRDRDYIDGEFFFFRIDGELESPVSENEPRSFQRLFKVSLDGRDTVFSHQSFEEARRNN